MSRLFCSMPGLDHLTGVARVDDFIDVARRRQCRDGKFLAILPAFSARTCSWSDASGCPDGTQCHRPLGPMTAISAVDGQVDITADVLARHDA